MKLVLIPALMLASSAAYSGVCLTVETDHSIHNECVETAEEVEQILMDLGVMDSFRMEENAKVEEKAEEPIWTPAGISQVIEAAKSTPSGSASAAVTINYTVTNPDGSSKSLTVKVEAEAEVKGKK